MKKISTLLAICFFSLICAAYGQEYSKQISMASTCRNCHDPEPGMMMGFLENISVKSRTILMDFLSHKTVVTFNDATTLVNVKSFADIRNHINKEFSIRYTEQNGKNIAQEINLFQPMDAIRKGDIKVDLLSMEQFHKRRSAPNTLIYDVRPLKRYQESHIPGAQSLPTPDFEKHKNSLPQDKNTPIILYGDGSCFGPITALNLKGLGYENVSIFAAGFHVWTLANPTITTVMCVNDCIDKKIPQVIIDLRDKSTVEKGHITGAVSIPYADLEKNKNNFPYYESAPIVLYGPNKEKAAATIVSWGYRGARILPVTYKEWAAKNNPVQTGAAKATITYEPLAKPGTISIPNFMKATQTTSAKTLLVDVRNPDEFEEAHIEGSINVPADSVKQRASEIGTSKDVIFFCPSGIRAEIAHNLFKSLGKKSQYLDAYLEFDEDGSFEVDEK